MKDANDILRASGADVLRGAIDSAVTSGGAPLPIANAIPEGCLDQQRLSLG